MSTKRKNDIIMRLFYSACPYTINDVQGRIKKTYFIILRKYFQLFVSKSPSPHAMLTLYAGQTWQRTVMAGAILSSRWSTSLDKTDEVHKKIPEDTKRKARVASNTTPTLLSPMDTSHSSAFPEKGSSVMSVLAVNVDRPPYLRSRSEAIITIIISSLIYTIHNT